MAERAEEIGVGKASMDAASTLVLAILAGAFIAFGASHSGYLTRWEEDTRITAS